MDVDVGFHGFGTDKICQKKAIRMAQAPYGYGIAGQGDAGAPQNTPYDGDDQGSYHDVRSCKKSQRIIEERHQEK